MKKTILENLYVWSAFQPDRAIDFNAVLLGPSGR